MKKVQEYSNDQIKVKFDPNTCQHAAVCVSTLSSVFNIDNRPWINVDGATKEEIVTMISNCPSGALTYEIVGDASEGNETASVEVTIMKGGPAVVSGKVKFTHKDGTVEEKEKMALCRCGQSGNKPFCDGSHMGVENFE